MTVFIFNGAPGTNQRSVAERDYHSFSTRYNLVLNTSHPAIQALIDKTEGQDERMKQLVDIALLASGQLKGEALAKFVSRSVDLLDR